MDASLTTLHEDDIAKHISLAQSFVTRFVVLEAAESRSKTELAGTRRRFVSTVATGGARQTRQVELSKAVEQAGLGNTGMLSIAQHGLIYRTRRGVAVALAVADSFAQASNLEALQEKNAANPLSGGEAGEFKSLLEAQSYIAGFSLAAYLVQTIVAEGEAAGDMPEPSYTFDTGQDAVKAILAGLETAIIGAKDDESLLQNARSYAKSVIAGLLSRRARFEGLAGFENSHIRLEADNFELNGFDVAPGEKRQALVMQFKKPNEIIGNHIAKYQSIKLAKMIMAYDFDRQLNPFVDLGGFLFTFIGDGSPGTGKTILIQMLAGMMNDYCQMAGYPFYYENFGVDQISSYQGKSGQNCRQFVDNVLRTNSIGFGTVDDIDQVAGRRGDDQSSAGQQEVTAVLMEAFAGANTVVRGNSTFGMFSNYPENVDDALRQRAGARWLVDGPQTQDDYIDIFALLAGKNHSIPLGDHELFEAQAIERQVSVAYEEHNRPKEDGLANIYDRFVNAHGELKTMADVGTYLHMIKLAEPRFTGRAIKNITDAIKMRAMDVELPDEWFEAPENFCHKDYDAKKAMIEELRGPFTLPMVMQEINRYADSEFRYADKSDEADVNKMIRHERLRERAAREIVELKDKGEWLG
ncbi:MAG: ATP-binding protein [Pseudomonadota bacterium]